MEWNLSASYVIPNEEVEEEEIIEEEEEHIKEKIVEDTPPEYVRKKKRMPTKVRRVNMEESVSSLEEENIKNEEVKEKDVLFISEKDIEHSDEMMNPEQDFTVEDPDFLDEFDSTKQDLIQLSEKSIIESKSELSIKREEEDEVTQEIFIQPPDKELSDLVYDKLCGLQTPISSDESCPSPKFMYVRRRKTKKINGSRFDEEESIKSDDPGQTGNISKYLMENILPDLKKVLIEVATLRPHDPVNYIAHSLMRRTRTREELGLDPERHRVQAVVDEKTKKKYPIHRRRATVILKQPGESLADKMSDSDVDVQKKTSCADDENKDNLHRIHMKYERKKQKILLSETANRSNLQRFPYMSHPNCSGPPSMKHKTRNHSRRI